MNDSSHSEAHSDVRHRDALLVGSRLAEFEILALLGVGGFGMVYKAFDHSLHRTVAIKEYMPATLAARAVNGALSARSITDGPAFAAGLHSFVDEARMLAQFDHPSLVKVFRFWEDKNTAYMVMPLYHGMTLKQARVHMRTPPPEAWLRKVLWSVLDALRVLHDANMLHRDISPENIFLQDFGPPVLLDLGASRYAINGNDTKNSVVLKVNYAPVEQYSESTEPGAALLQQGPWSDLYSLAAMVHGCLCNDAPLPATLRAVRDRLAPFARVAKTVETQFGQAYSESFVNAISEALKVQPQDRPQSIDAFLALLQMSMPPADIEHFDFRAELGNIWNEPSDQAHWAAGLSIAELAGQPLLAATGGAAGALITAPGEADSEQSAHESDAYDGPATVFLEDERLTTHEEAPERSAKVAAAAALASGFAGARGQKNKPPKPQTAESDISPAVKRRRAALSQSSTSKKKPWLWLGLIALFVAGAVAMGMHDKPAPERATVLSAAKAVVASSDAILTELKDPATDSAAVLLGANGQPIITEAVLVATAIAQETAEPSHAPPAVARPRPKKKSAPPPPEPPPEPVEVIVPPPPPAPMPAPEPVRPPTPKALCTDSNALTRSSCLRAECRNAGNRSNPACVEFRKAMEPLERNQFAN